MTQTPTDALRLVPVEPTPKMLKAAFAAMNATPSGEWKRMKAENKTPREIFDAKMRPRWSAMLAAAPASPLPGGGWQDMTCDEQFALATEIAANIGYVLQPEPDHPDCPHARQGVAKILRDQLNDKSRRLRPLPAAPTGVK